MYEQFTPTKLYTAKKAKTTQVNDITCRMCGKAPENLPHVLAGCPSTAQNKYLSRYNAALRVLFFEKLRDLELIDAVPPWYSPADRKPVYESQEAKAFWDIPVYAEHSHVKQNRVDARFSHFKKNEVVAVEMSCQWKDKRLKKTEEKIVKYGPLIWEMTQQYPGYTVRQHNVIIDVLGGWSRDVDASVRELFGGRGEDILRKMQKAVLSNSLNISKTLNYDSIVKELTFMIFRGY